MKKMICIFATVAAACMLTGCGHNVINYGDGIGFDAGINPENMTFSFNLRYGKILSAVTRDNVEIEMTGKATADGTAGTAGKAGAATDGNLKVKIGKQVNGYTVDLEEIKNKKN